METENPLSGLRLSITDAHLQSESQILATLQANSPVAMSVREIAGRRSQEWVEEIRLEGKPELMEVFLAEYGLSSNEGVALMCLAEALLRVPDVATVDALIEDKIAPSDWSLHLGHSASSLVNASTWALMLTGKVFGQQSTPDMATVLHGMVRRLGEPVVRVAVRRAIKEMGNQFVLGQTIKEALERGSALQKKGFIFSYDMLGEAALTAKDAQHFYQAYAQAIDTLALHSKSEEVRQNPGISVKLSALYPRYETPKQAQVMLELVPKVLRLAQAAKAAGIGFNIDAEEANRLELSLEVIQAVLSDPSLAGWNGFGVVVQAYSKRALAVIEWLHALAESLDRRVMVRLVKGAYWDSEIKRAQVEGLTEFPVFTRKAATDVAYLCCAQTLLRLSDRVYPQFASHNAHTLVTVLEMARALGKNNFELQRLQGMGKTVHDKALAEYGVRCRIYAPVGPHRDLLAYLVRRLLENGANSSFVNQIVNKDLPAAQVVSDPFSAPKLGQLNPAVILPPCLFEPERRNSQGFDCFDRVVLDYVEQGRTVFKNKTWSAAPVLVIAEQGADEKTPTNTVQTAVSLDCHAVINPSHPTELVGKVRFASPVEANQAIAAALPWSTSVAQRADILNRAADLYESHAVEWFALLAKEAGKTLPDAVAELREAVDFLRYYAAQAVLLTLPARGRFVCISPWNFPLAIFTGQIAAALAAGNAVLAKPAETTSLVAAKATALLHEAGVPVSALQLLPGIGTELGPVLTSHSSIDGVVFTGSTATAQSIYKTMASNLASHTPLIAETGGLNAMVVDSTALPEQAVRDIVNSAFRSAGQRCSALRVLYLQEDVADTILEMIYGAMDALKIAAAWDFESDLGPVIDAKAQAKIMAYIGQAQERGQVLKSIPVPEDGYFVPACVIQVSGIQALPGEIFGPVLHVVKYAAKELDAVVDAINATGYGLTFGMHSRIDDRIQQVVQRIKVGNIYINRNQIGAVVGSQPFGGHGLSGTGPKAGGPLYLSRFCLAPLAQQERDAFSGTALDFVKQATIEKALARVRAQAEKHPTTSTSEETRAKTMPGPTGESNRWSCIPRGVILCLGPGRQAALEQAKQARAQGCGALMLAVGIDVEEGLDGSIDPSILTVLTGFDALAFWGAEEQARILRQALAARLGPCIPLLREADLSSYCILEQHVCIDTTASGGNASLLAQVA